MNTDTVNFLLTLFIATFTVTGILWMILAMSGQASFNVTSDADTPTKENE